jgi:hypothetical protein
LYRRRDRAPAYIGIGHCVRCYVPFVRTFVQFVSVSSVLI